MAFFFKKVQSFIIFFKYNLVFLLIFCSKEFKGQEFVVVEKSYSNMFLKQKYQGIVYGNDTIRQGKYSFYYENGRLMQEGYYKDNKPDSIWLTFYPSGARKSLINYKNGKRIGEFVFWNDDATLYQIGNYESDELDGKLITYFPKGTIDSESNYKNGFLKNHAPFRIRSKMLDRLFHPNSCPLTPSL